MQIRKKNPLIYTHQFEKPNVSILFMDYDWVFVLHIICIFHVVKTFSSIGASALILKISILFLSVIPVNLLGESRGSDKKSILLNKQVRSRELQGSRAWWLDSCHSYCSRWEGFVDCKCW